MGQLVNEERKEGREESVSQAVSHLTDCLYIAPTDSTEESPGKER